MPGYELRVGTQVRFEHGYLDENDQPQYEEVIATVQIYEEHGGMQITFVDSHGYEHICATHRDLILEILPDH